MYTEKARFRPKNFETVLLHKKPKDEMSLGYDTGAASFLSASVSSLLYKWHATYWFCFASCQTGFTFEQISIAIGQRVRNTQPLGGLIGLGSSPFKIIRSRFSSTSESGIGMAERSAFVYG